MIDLHDERIKHEEMIAGTICATIANWGFRAPKEPVKSSDFFSRIPQKEKKIRRTKANGQKVSNDIRTWVQSLQNHGLVIVENG